MAKSIQFGLKKKALAWGLLGLTCGFLKIQAGFFTLKNPNQVGFVPDNYKNTE